MAEKPPLQRGRGSAGSMTVSWDITVIGAFGEIADLQNEGESADSPMIQPNRLTVSHFFSSISDDSISSCCAVTASVRNATTFSTPFS
jgi:hypothetical protein